MNKETFNLVGLRYHFWKGEKFNALLSNPEQGFKAIQKTQLLVKATDSCRQDKYAVEMIDTMGNMIGYVAHRECAPLWNYLKQHNGLIPVNLLKFNTARHSLILRTPVAIDMSLKPSCITDWTAVPNWTEGITLPAEYESLNRITMIIEQTLTGSLPKQFLTPENTERFMQFTANDISGDMYARRLIIASQMMQSTDCDIKQTGIRLTALIDHMGSAEMIRRWHDEVFRRMTCSEWFHANSRLLSATAMKHRDEWLEALPEGIGTLMLNMDMETCIARIYYSGMPLRLILQMLMAAGSIIESIRTRYLYGTGTGEVIRNYNIDGNFLDAHGNENVKFIK